MMNTSALSINLSYKNQKRIAVFILWSVAVFLSVYYLPKVIGIFISVALAFYTYYTKKNDIIILMLFVFIGLGMAGTISTNDLPKITIVLGYSINTLDLMSISIFLKILPTGILTKSRFSFFFIIFFFYVIFNSIINYIIQSINLDIGMGLFRIFFYYILYFYCVYTLKNIEDFGFVIKILFYFAIIIWGTQIYVAFGGPYLITLLKGGTHRLYYISQESTSIRAIMRDVLSPFLLFVLSLSFLNIVKDKKWRRIFYISIASFILSVFISAARVWALIILVTLVGFLRSTANIKKGFQIALISILLFVLIFFAIGGKTFIYFQDILGRLGGLTKVASGSYEDVGTFVSRLNQLEHIRGVISQSPIIGFGLTQTTSMERNCNLGFANTILTFGILGQLVIIYLLINYIMNCRSTLKKISKSNPFYKVIYVFLFAWFAIIIAYSFSWDFFTLAMGGIIFMSLFLGITDCILRESIKFEYQQNNNTRGIRL